MAEHYRRGVEYVECPQCGSHLLLESEWRESWINEHCDDYGASSRCVFFTCDAEHCEYEFLAEVKKERS